MEISLRPYQENAIQQLRYGLSRGCQNQLLCAPTGAGKTLIASYLVKSSAAKLKRCAFVVDRNVLVDQTSEVFCQYGIPHGVIQGDHPLYKPWERVQIISAQTMERRRGVMDGFDLIVVDECHSVRKETTEILKQRACPAIGLTATPFAKGLGQIYDNLVNVTTTDKLIADGFLSDYSVFSCREPDMTGVRVVAGEWEKAMTTDRALVVVGDVVKEYIEKASGRKFICSAVNTKHVEALQAQFQGAGICTATFTYRTNADERRQIVEEFRKPDSYIRGLITVTAATKGFDVADVDCIIMARPLRKALAEHIQLLGRGLRPFPGKEKCIVLDHAGNCARFWNAMQYFFTNGAETLDDKDKVWQKSKPAEDEERSVKCASCNCLYSARLPFCPECGIETPRRKSDIVHVEGGLKAIGKNSIPYGVKAGDIQSQIKTHVLRRTTSRPDKMYIAIYKTLTGKWPKTPYTEVTPAAEIEPWLAGKLKQMQIAYAKRRAA